MQKKKDSRMVTTLRYSSTQILLYIPFNIVKDTI